MSDHSELKRLAEALPAKAWRAAQPNAGGRGWEVAQGTDQVAADITGARAKFIAAANPAAVLALIEDAEGGQGEFAGLQAMLETAQSERDQLKAEVESLRKLVADVVTQHPRPSRRGDAPGHCHLIPGIWDSDNGDKAGTECGWCKVWNAAIAMSKVAS
jgi:hypothetical protein